jgi:MFS family permease
VTTARSLASTTFRSLKTRNYKLFFYGQGASLIGTWMQTIALGWLVLDLSDDSGFAVGFVLALQFVPTLVLGAWGGVVADRFDKRNVMVITQSVMAVSAAVLGVLVVGDVITLWMVYVLVFAFGAAQAFDNPARLSFVSEMVEPNDLSNAVALNSTLFQVARILGPAVAGVLIVVVDTGPCFLLNAVSYVAVIGALLAMDTSSLHRGAPVAKEKGQIREGLRYVWRTAELRALLLLTLIVGTLAINFPVVLPLVAKVTFDGNADTYSIMTIAMGIPALIGGLVIAHRSNLDERVLFASGLFFGASILVAALAPSLLLFVLLIAIVGGGQIFFMSTCNTMAQLRAEPRMRGRVMAVYVMAVLGSTPVGGPLIGWISEEFGPRYGLAVGGVATFVATLVLGGMMLRERRATDAATREAQTDLAPA